MKMLFLVMLFSAATNVQAQTDTIRAAKDYIRLKEKTDPNMYGVRIQPLKSYNNSKAIVLANAKQDAQKIKNKD